MFISAFCGQKTNFSYSNPFSNKKMNFILHLLVDAAVIFGLAYVMPQVDVKNFTTALIVALVLALLNATIGWVLRGVGNLVTFSLLGFVVRLLVTAFLLTIIDKFMDGLTINGFLPAVIIALAVAVAGAIIDNMFADRVATDTLSLIHI